MGMRWAGEQVGRELGRHQGGHENWEETARRGLSADQSPLWFQNRSVERG